MAWRACRRRAARTPAVPRRAVGGRATRADPERRRLELSVTELARAGVRAPRALDAWRALQLGSALHADYQARAAAEDASFRSEVALQAELAHEKWSVALRGRCDALRAVGDGWCVQELKTGRGSAHVSAELLHAHRLQAAAYAWMWQRECREAVRAELVWLSRAGIVAVEPLPWSEAQRDAALFAALDECIREAERVAARRAQWREASRSLRFPFAQERPAQRRMREAVEGTLAAGEALLLEAPTGSGKTAAALFPALRHALESGRRVWFLTASGLQQEQALATLARMAPEGLCTAAQLRAKRAMCATGELVCHPRACVYADDYARKLRDTRLVERALAAPTAEAERVLRLASAAGACPHEAARDVAAETPLSVLDTNYAFDPQVVLSELRDPEVLRDAVLVVDEVHRLPARARENWTRALSASATREAAERCALGSSPAHRTQRALCEALAALIERSVADVLPDEAGDALVEAELPAHELRELAASFDEAAGELLDALAGDPAGPSLAFLRLSAQLARFVEEPAHPRAFASLAGRENGDALLERTCLDPAPMLRATMSAAHAVIGLSATLSPADHHRRALGLDEARCHHLEVAPEDVSARRTVVIDASVTTRFSTRSRELPRLAKRLTRFVDELPGSALALAPSFAVAEALARLVTPARHRVDVQRADDSAETRAGRIAALGDGAGLLFAVAGGALAEGADYAGAPLSGVAIVGPCLPPPAPRLQLLQRHVEEEGGDGFLAAYAIPGIARVVQGAGRLLRTERDRGVIALFDRRFLEEPYRSLLPRDWGDPESLAGDAAAVARAFFAESAHR